MAAVLRSAASGPATDPGGWVPDQAPDSAGSRPFGVLRGRVDLGGPGCAPSPPWPLSLRSAPGCWPGARPVALPAPAPSPVPSSVAGAVGSPSARPAAPRVLVHVTGKVQRPGVVALPAGARVVDALRAAGGLRAGVDPGTLNLARRVVDGEQIVAGAPAASASAPAASAPAASANGDVVDLNAAPVSDLDALPGVGPVLAQRIVDWRTRHGPFRDIAQLRDVDGIGEQRFEDLRDRVRV